MTTATATVDISTPSCQQVSEIIVNVCKQSNAAKETAKLITNIFLIVTGAALPTVSAASALVSVLEFPSAIDYFIQGKQFDLKTADPSDPTDKTKKKWDIGKILNTAAQVVILIAAILGTGKALDTIFACMSWVSKVLGYIPIIGETLASTPFVMVISIVTIPLSLLNIAATAYKLANPDPKIATAAKDSKIAIAAEIEKRENIIKIAVDITKLVGAILAIIGVAAGIGALTVVGAVVAVAGAILAIARLYLGEQRKLAPAAA